MIWIIAGILILAVVFYFAHKLSLGFIGREEPVENPLPNPNDDWYEYMQDYYGDGRRVQNTQRSRYRNHLQKNPNLRRKSIRRNHRR